MRERLPEAYEQFLAAADTLERHYRDMQDIEFTVEDGRLYLLQTRSGKRTAAAALKIGVDMVDEGHVTQLDPLGRPAEGHRTAQIGADDVETPLAGR